MFKDTQTDIIKKCAIIYSHKADLKDGANGFEDAILYFRKVSWFSIIVAVVVVFS
jgi:hypothetical protein